MAQEGCGMSINVGNNVSVNQVIPVSWRVADFGQCDDPMCGAGRRGHSAFSDPTKGIGGAYNACRSNFCHGEERIE